jgi:aldehyde:ferredoxin oxidoreductase
MASEKYKDAHKILAEFNYPIQPVIHGYADRTLYIDLTSNKIESRPVTQEMKNIFTGGRGFGLWLLWNATTPETKWDDPENEFVIAGGPIGGITAYPGSGKSTVVTISPLTKIVHDSNGGGHFGPYLKFSGWDALEIQGKAEEDVIIFIDGDTGQVRIETAPLEPLDSHLLNRLLTEMYAVDEKDYRNFSVVSTGQAGDHSAMCGVNLSYYDKRHDEVRVKQAARGGSGRVMRDKKIKAIVVHYSSLKGDSNGPADMALLRKAGKRMNEEMVKFDAPSDMGMRHVGTARLVRIMNDHDLLPVENYRYGADPRHKQIDDDYWREVFIKDGLESCWYGCTMACAHGVECYQLQSGPYKGDKVLVDGPEYETLDGLGPNCGIFDPNAILELNFYCDTYGIDTISLGTSIAFVMECYEYGILDKDKTGGLELTWGNQEVVFELMHQLARGEGFGHIVGQGIRYMKQYFIDNFGADPGLMQDIGMEVKGLEVSEYITKESLSQQGGYGMASKGAQHDEAWLIFMDMVNKQLPTFEKKAEALHYFPMWRTWFSLHGLCKLPWNDVVPEDNHLTEEPSKVPEHVENYCWLYEGVTGKKITPEGLILQSERVYNFQRLFNLRLGRGKRNEDYPPYRAVGPVTVKEYESRVERYDEMLKKDVGLDVSGMSTEEKVAAMREYREDQYNTLVDNVYRRRGWDENGIPTLETVKRLQIDFPEIVELIKANAN